VLSKITYSVYLTGSRHASLEVASLEEIDRLQEDM
jgi:hypothetical protein